MPSLGSSEGAGSTTRLIKFGASDQTLLTLAGCPRAVWHGRWHPYYFACPSGFVIISNFHEHSQDGKARPGQTSSVQLQCFQCYIMLAEVPGMDRNPCTRALRALTDQIHRCRSPSRTHRGLLMRALVLGVKEGPGLFCRPHSTLQLMLHQVGRGAQTES